MTIASAASANEADEASLSSSKPRAIDPGVAPGPVVAYADRPAIPGDLPACSPRVPVCVHPAGASDGPRALATLAAFERTWATLTGALEVPPPEVDPLTLAYDVFLADRDATLLEARDVRSHVDRGRAFSLVDRHAGCALDLAAATAVARASLLGVAPATEEATAIAQSTYLATLAVPCALPLLADDVAVFQRNAARTFVDAHVDEIAVAGGWDDPVNARFARGASTFWARLDWAFGRSPGRIVTAAWALHPTMTPVGADRWWNEPDTFDVLRVTFKGAFTAISTVDDLLLDFGVARAFFGTAADDLHAPELRTLGEAARVPLDWDIPWPERPRSLAQKTPVAPLGASYLSIQARADKRLRVEIEWEEHALFRWAFVKVDRAGREMGRVPIPIRERATEARMTLVDLAGVDHVLLVGVNVGDPAYAFDPDDGVWEPHGWVVTLAEE